MNILGIDWGEHDSAASLLQDGHLVAAVEEERLSRIKHAPFAFPARAARWCLEAGGLTPADVDVVAYSFSPTVGLGRGFLHAIRHFPRANFIALAELARRLWYAAPRAYAHYELKIPARTRTVYVPHHLAHAASAYYPSPFDRAAVLVVDGAWVSGPSPHCTRAGATHSAPLAQSPFRTLWASITQRSPSTWDSIRLMGSTR